MCQVVQRLWTQVWIKMFIEDKMSKQIQIGVQ